MPHLAPKSSDMGKINLNVEVISGWSIALDAARRTVGKAPLRKEPSRDFKIRSLFAEHSQIKLVTYLISFKDLRQWVGVHLLRHRDVLPFIHSQRVDRREDIEVITEQYLSIVSEDLKNSPEFNRRDYLPQGAPNDQDFYVNAQTLINISRKRLCHCASKETRQAWEAVREALKDLDPEVASAMVPNCIYRGRCPEVKTCGYYLTNKFREELDNYWQNIGR